VGIGAQGEGTERMEERQSGNGKKRGRERERKEGYLRTAKTPTPRAS